MQKEAIVNSTTRHTQMKKSAQRDANIARALAVARFGHCPPEISALDHVTQAMPILASFCFPYTRGVRRPSLYQI